MIKKLLLNTRIFIFPPSKVIYVPDVILKDLPFLVKSLFEEGQRYDCTKILVRTPARYVPEFIGKQYHIEAFIPGLFVSKEDGFLMAYYMDGQRCSPDLKGLEKLQQMLGDSPRGSIRFMGSKYTLASMRPKDAVEMAGLYEQVLSSYPFPLADSKFIEHELRKSNLRFFGVYHESELIALSAAVFDLNQRHAEFTHFAVVPAHRGNGLAATLLAYMEAQMINEGMKCFYTSSILGLEFMDAAVMKQGYRYAGTLINQLLIGDTLESLNVWYKRAV